MAKTVTAVFNTRIEAETALEMLEEGGFTKEQVSLLLSDETRRKHFGLVESNKAEEGATLGATIAGLSAALFLALTTAGSLLIPGLNLIVSGAWVGALVGLGSGAAAGGVVGALIGMGIPEHEARLYDEQLKGGAILVAVDVAEDAGAKRVEKIFEAAQAQSVTAIALNEPSFRDSPAAK